MTGDKFNIMINPMTSIAFGQRLEIVASLATNSQLIRRSFFLFSKVKNLNPDLLLTAKKQFITYLSINISHYKLIKNSQLLQKCYLKWINIGKHTNLSHNQLGS